MKAKATVGGAVSLVNAIATGRGATLGTGQHVTVIAEAEPGTGISIHSGNRNLSSRLVSKTVQTVLPQRTLDRNRIIIGIESDIPAGYGLKSSSAISCAVALGCAKLFGVPYTDRTVIGASVSASLESGVSITGAYDDACACYYGGFNVTDNSKRRLVFRRRAPAGLDAVIFIPTSRKRCSMQKIRTLDAVFGTAWDAARRGRYWEAMTLNGLATSATLDSDPQLIADLLDKGALGASISGNGPAMAAISRTQDTSRIRKLFARREGRTIVAKLNNKKAEVHEV